MSTPVDTPSRESTELWLSGLSYRGHSSLSSVLVASKPPYLSTFWAMVRLTVIFGRRVAVVSVYYPVYTCGVSSTTVRSGIPPYVRKSLSPRPAYRVTNVHQNSA